MRTLLVLMAVALLAGGCSKDASTDNDGLLQGRWELREMRGQVLMTFAPLNGNELRLTSNTFERYTNGVLTSSGTYTVVPDLTASESVGLVLEEGTYTKRIVFSDEPNKKVFYQRKGNELSLMQGFFPSDSGSESIYVRIADAGTDE